jgi:TonB family protein
MMCLLKRVIPFALTLVIGLALGSFFGKGLHQTTVIAHKQAGFADGSGAGWRGNLDDGRPFAPLNVDKKARVLARPEPQYTEQARENQVEGTVVLRAVFSSTGEVTNIRVVSGLPNGLTEKAVEAAQQIKFTPAMKDGRPVSQYIQVEYNFNLY